MEEKKDVKKNVKVPVDNELEGVTGGESFPQPPDSDGWPPSVPGMRVNR